MTEAVYNASGMGLPIVMTLGNRAIGAPINIWNDHSDAMALRDAGWIMLFAETNQEAVDLHIQAFRLAEELSTPIMVCVDGFILTHAYEEVEIPTQEAVDAYLPPFNPSELLDPSGPKTMGALVGPEYFTEVRYLAHHKQRRALERIPELAQEFALKFGRESGGLLRTYRTNGAETIIVALGSISGTIKDATDELRDNGQKIGAVQITTFRPFPFAAIHQALARASQIIVVEKSLTAGMGGPLAAEIRLALNGESIPVHSVIAGLGGRQITKESLKNIFRRANDEELPDTTFLDMNWEIVNAVIADE